MDLARVRRDFPILERRFPLVGGGERPLCYMDHGASTHPPRQVIDRVSHVLSHQYANIHRGNHTLSLESSDLFDGVYDTFARFIGAKRPEAGGTGMFVLTQNTTMALDLCAHVMTSVPGKTLTTRAEHHSNDLPHRRAAANTPGGGVLYADVDDLGRPDLHDMERLLQTEDVKLVAVTGASNVTGHMPPIHKIARLAHDHGAKILVDAAQLYAHAPIDVRPDDHPEHIDFLAAAGHKAYAPYGSAFLYGPQDIFDAAPPYLPGGGTVTWVQDDDAMFAPSPDRHMGGTPNIAGAIAFAAATDYLLDIGMDQVRAHEMELAHYAHGRFAELQQDHGVRLVGPQDVREKVGVMSFDVPGVSHDKVSAILNHEHAIATRNGCFCAQPLLHRLLGLGDLRDLHRAMDAGAQVPIPGLVRATIGIYNDYNEVDRLFAALEDIASGRIQAKYEIDDHRVCKPVQFEFPREQHSAATIAAGPTVSGPKPI